MAVKDLSSKTVNELKALAKKAGISVRSSWKKADIIKVLGKGKPSGAAKKSISKLKKRPVAKKTASKKTAKKAVKKVSRQTAKKAVKRTLVKKASKKSTKKVKKTAAKAVKKASAKTPVKKAVSKSLTNVKKKTSQKSTTKKTVKKTSARSGVSKKASPGKGSAAKAVLQTPKATEKKGVRYSGRNISKSSVLTRTAVDAAAKPAASQTTRISLLVVDPYKLFAFWEINEKDLNDMVKDGGGFSFLLRVYFFREGEQTGFFDVKISEPFGKKYIEVIPERGYQVELLLIKKKASYSLARSSVKYTPAFRIDREFSSPEESEIYLSQVPRPGGRISS